MKGAGNVLLSNGDHLLKDIREYTCFYFARMEYNCTGNVYSMVII
jgi:hypothetical protein